MVELPAPHFLAMRRKAEAHEEKVAPAEEHHVLGQTVEHVAQGIQVPIHRVRFQLISAGSRARCPSASVQR